MVDAPASALTPSPDGTMSTSRRALLVRRPNLDVVVSQPPGDGASWCDVVALPCSRTVISAGQLTASQGADPAAVATTFRAALARWAESECPPSLLLRQLDGYVRSSPLIERVALSLAHFDAAGHQLVVGEAGMPAAVVTRDGLDEVAILDGSLSPELGGRPRDFKEQSTELTEGDVVSLWGGRVTGAASFQWVGPMAQDARDLDQFVHTFVPKLGEVAVAFIRDQAIPIVEMDVRDTSEVAGVRRLVSELLDRWGLADMSDDGALVVSELVGNAIHHARGGSASMRIHRRADAVVVEVADNDGALPQLRQPTFDDDRGRGMLIVQEISDRWGCRRTEVGKVVWAELIVPPALLETGAP